MRHRKGNNNLKRKSAHRKAMLANMSCSLIMHKRIKTTLAKAKALRKFIEPIITRSKHDSTHNRRISFSYLRQKEAVTELFSNISDKVADRPGGYTRIIKLGNRLGDAAEMCFIELVDFNDIYNSDKTKKKRTRRSKRSENISSEEIVEKQVLTQKLSSKPVSEEPKAEEPKAEEPVSEEPVSEEPKEEPASEDTNNKD